MFDKPLYEGIVLMAKKGVPKHDGSGKGEGANKGRGGCSSPKGGQKGRRQK